MRRDAGRHAPVDLFQAKRLPASRLDEPAAPVAIAVGLVAYELHPREPARVFDVRTRGAYKAGHGAIELRPVLEEELLFVAAQLGTSVGFHDGLSRRATRAGNFRSASSRARPSSSDSARA